MIVLIRNRILMYADFKEEFCVEFDVRLELHALQLTCV